MIQPSDFIKGKKVSAHKGFFNSASRKKYKENSKEVCRVTSQKSYIDTIELDVRKSSDGILYCYHGTIFDYYIYLQFSHTFSKLREKYHVDTLQDILTVITPDKRIFLDIKDTSITRADIIDTFKNKHFKEVMLANKSVSYLDRFTTMPKNFSKIMNSNIFCTLYDLHTLHNKGYTYFEVIFPFQVSHKKVREVRSHNIEFGCSGQFFWSTQQYRKLFTKYGLTYISSDYV